MRNIAVALLLVCSSAVAHADDKKVAAGHFRAGSALYERGEYAAALAEFDAGFNAFPMPAFHINMAQCHRKLEHFDEAALEYTRFLDAGAGDPGLREEVREALVEVRQLSGERASRRAPAPAASAPAPAPARVAPAAVVLTPPVARPAPAALFLAATPPPRVAPAKKSRWWVWTIVGVAAAGAVAASVAVAYVETQPAGPRAGSLGLLDGRR